MQRTGGNKVGPFREEKGRGRDGLTGGQWAGSGWPHIPPVERRGLEPHRAHLGAQALGRLTASLLSRGFPSLS